MAECRNVQDRLFDAIRKADLERVKLCLESGAQINSMGGQKTFPLHQSLRFTLYHNSQRSFCQKSSSLAVFHKAELM